MPVDSDSEEDLDYTPPDAGISDAEEPDAKRPRVSSPLKLSEEEEEAKKKVRENLWVEFRASTVTPATPLEQASRKLVKIEKRYRFAGEDVIEIEEVPDNSEDAKTWPHWIPKDNVILDQEQSSIPAEPLPSTSTLSTAQITPIAGKSERPRPRKPKTCLPPLPAASSSKAKKLTTLDKSAMDWQAHLSSSQDSELRDQLEANRRGGGYLDKVEFLQRVGERKDGFLEANKSSKRRR